jgi:hypothetical protein
MGCALVLTTSTEYFYRVTPTTLKVEAKQTSKARAKDELNGKAQPFLTTGA